MRRPPARLVVVLVGVLMAAIACGGGSSSSGGSSASPSAAPIPGVKSLDLTDQRYHLHFLGPLHYVQVPPMGGDHSPLPLNCGVYTSPVPNENAVHSLEHGAVWMTYKPGVDPAPLTALTSINPSYTLVSPYPSQPSPVTVTAWGLQLRVDSPTDPRIRQFVTQYVGNGLGGEKGARCAGVTPQEGQQLLANPPQPNPTPPPDPADRPG
jgi:hypothetical protein